jgi:surfeit locus 1 family protein
MVAIALPTLIGFGVWQLQRLQWKEALLHEARVNSTLPILSLHERPPADLTQLPFRRVWMNELDCPDTPAKVVAGRNLAGEVGYSYIFRCRWPSWEPGPVDDRQEVLVNAGWARKPDIKGSEINGFPHGRFWLPKGTLIPGRSPSDPMTFYYDGMARPLIPSAVPGPETISNNHLSYAIQWFSFATILAIIYGLWLRRWLATNRPRA